MEEEETDVRYRAPKLIALLTAIVTSGGLAAAVTLAGLVPSSGAARNSAPAAVSAPTSASAAAVTTYASAGTHEETDPLVQYAGDWRAMESGSDSADASAYLNSAGSAKLAFSGTGFTWISRTSPSSGINDVLIDGTKVASVDRYSTDKGFQVPVFTVNNLSSGNHTVEIVWTGKKNANSTGTNVLVDSLIVTGTTSGTTSGTAVGTVAVSSVTVAGIGISWSTPAGVDGARVLRSKNGGAYVAVADLPATQTGYLDISVTPGAKYAYAIGALDGSGREIGRSAAVSATAVAAKPASSFRYSNCPAATVTVGTSAGLASALSSAKAGTVIRLNAGTYVGEFKLYNSGSSTAPIWICGPRTAIITTGSTQIGHGLLLNGVSNVVAAGFTIRDSLKGLTIIEGSNVVATDLLVERIGYEAVHARNQTTDTEIKYNVIRQTGLVQASYGEGIYVGTSETNWCKFNNCQPDQTRRILLYGNTISATGAQPIEAKAGTSSGVVAANTLTGVLPGQKGTEWVLIKGNDWVVADNIGKNSPVDGFATNASVDGWGMNNIFTRNNASTVAEYGTWIHEPVSRPNLGNRVSCLGTVTSASSGFTNVDCED